MSHWKSCVYIINPCYVISFKHTFYFARDKIKCADVVESINHVTFLTNRFLRLISLPTSTVFVSRTSESVSYFLEFSCLTTILKILECKFYKCSLCRINEKYRTKCINKGGDYVEKWIFCKKKCIGILGAYYCPNRGLFCLLRFRPGPVRSSLINLVSLSSLQPTILKAGLVQTPDRHTGA